MIARAAVQRGGALLLAVPQIAAPEWQTRHNVLMMVAAILFSSLTVAVAVVLGLLSVIHDSLDLWSLRIKSGLRAHLFICVSGSVHYISEWTFESHLVVKTEDGGDHLITRNFHWLVSTPLQLYIYSLVFSDPTVRHSMVPTYCLCCSMQIFGILMMVTTYPGECCVLSCVSFVAMFAMLAQVPLLPETSALARKSLVPMIALWSCYPGCMWLASSGVVSRETEQLYLYPLLDCCTKCLTLGSVLMARIVRTLASIDGSLQLVMAAHDLLLVVDPSFRLLEAVRDAPQLSSYFASDDSERNLLALCSGEDQKALLHQVAQTADVQPFGAPSPKCMVVFKLRGGVGEVLTDCYMSKCVQGRRTVGIAVRSVSGHPDLEAIGSGVMDIDAGSSISEHFESLTIPPTEMQLELALHNCATVLELDPALAAALRRIFLDHPTAPTALFLFERNERAEMTLLAVSSAFATSFGSSLPTPATPCEMANVLREEDIEHLQTALEIEELVAYQLEGAQLPAMRATASVTVLPLNRLSATASASEVRIGVLLMESVSPRAALAEQARQHAFWYFAGPKLLRLTAGLERTVTSPLLVRGPPGACRAEPQPRQGHVGHVGAELPHSCWHVFLALPRRASRDGNLGDKPLELVVPADENDLWQEGTMALRPDCVQQLDAEAVRNLLLAPCGPRPEHQVPPSALLQPLAYQRRRRRHGFDGA